MNSLTHFFDKWRISTARLASISSILVLATSFFSPLWAVDCQPMSMALNTQAEVDSFQATYGPCDRVLTLYVEGTDISNLDGLSALTEAGSSLYIQNNPILVDVDGLSELTIVTRNLWIQNNASLTNLDSLSALTRVGIKGSGNAVVLINNNEALSQCEGMSRLVDQWDDAEPGPGGSVFPDVAGEVIISDNLPGCNSIQEILATARISRINAGLNDAWYYPETDGQGFFINVFPELAVLSLAWFTYDTEPPADDMTANLGDPAHRWITAIGPIVGNQVLMDIEMTSGGLFDTAPEIQRTEPPGSDGTILLTFSSCNSGTVEYDIPSINRHGTIHIQRVANDNIALCEVLSAD